MFQRILTTVSNANKLFNKRVVTNSYFISALNKSSHSKDEDDVKKSSSNETNVKNDISIPHAVATKFNVFKDEESPVILDIQEERRKTSAVVQEIEVDDDGAFSNIKLKRGVTGVYDVEELVELLRRENALDIFVAKVPSEYTYVDYFIVVTGRSRRHMIAMAEFVRRVFKKKAYQSDVLPKIEGESSKEWMALDLGNIALHIFSKDARYVYDLESLWSLGKEYDEKLNEPDSPIITLLQSHSATLNNMKPADCNFKE